MHEIAVIGPKKMGRMKRQGKDGETSCEGGLETVGLTGGALWFE